MRAGPVISTTWVYPGGFEIAGGLMKRVFDIPFSPVCASACGNSSARLAAFHGRIPPRTRAGLQLVISFHHLHRYPRSRLRGPDAHVARLGAAFGRQPRAVMPPQARAFGALVRRPGVGIDAAPAPAVLDQEVRRAP